MFSKYSKRQWVVLYVYSVVNILSAFCISLQAPFYPMVAEAKGATPSQYGMVFGTFTLVLFLVSPLTGIMINKFGVVNVSLLGLLITGISSIIFGFVDQLNGMVPFISVSVLIRIFEGLGYSMARNAGVAIVSCEFSEDVETAFAIVQTFFSTGQIIGPVTGGALYELGGFYLPFVVIGALILCSASIVLFLPSNYPRQETKTSKNFVKVLRESSVILGIFILFGTYVNSAFIMTILEPHIKSLNLSPLQIGSLFLCNGVAYSCSACFWSLLCKKYSNTLICSLSSFFIVCGLLLIGPAPYLPFDMNIYTCIFGLIIQRIGLAGNQVGGFSILNKCAYLAGLPKNIQTSGLVSTIFTSSMSFGSFIGPVLGGYIFETFGFPWGSHLFIAYHLILLLVIILCSYLWSGRQELSNNTKLLSSTEYIEKYESIASK